MENDMHDFLNRLGCAGLVAAVIFPFGQVAFPYLVAGIGEIQIDAIEITAAVGLGKALHAMLFG